MYKKASLTISLLFLFGCKTSQNLNVNSFSGLNSEELYSDSNSIRAIASDNDTIYYAGSEKKVGYLIAKTRAKLELQLNSNAKDFEFRSLALTTNYVYILSVGSPALLYRFSRNLTDKELVYKEDNAKAFYDSMHFFNDKEGIAIGDPTENCLSILITKDYGKTWKKISCDLLPKTAEGEAAFAASNTNISISGNSCWIVSGGVQSRVFYSSDKGNSWTVYETPIVQGKAMTGIFTSDFYNEKIGFISGGDYENPNQNFQNKAITFNGGKTWKLVGENTGFGYASCVQFVPKSNASGIVSVGVNGIFYSTDFGKNWKQFSTDPNLYTIRFISPTEAIAAGKNKIVKLTFY